MATTQPLGSTPPLERLLTQVNRRYFLRTGTLAAATGALVLTGCQDHPAVIPPAGTVDLGSGDVGILNYAYALEQLEAAFYTMAVQMPFAGMTMEEKSILTDIRDHEIAHREFFKAALGAAAIPGLEVNFSSIDFNSRDSVLKAARIFEDTGVAAYNGAGKLISSRDYLLLAGKIVSVEARHAAIIRELILPNTSYFASEDVIDMNGLDKATPPSMILPAVQPFVKTPLSGANLPK